MIKFLYLIFQTSLLGIPGAVCLFTIFSPTSNWLFVPALAYSGAGWLAIVWVCNNSRLITVSHSGREGYVGSLGPFPVIEVNSGSCPGPCIVRNYAWEEAHRGEIKLSERYTFRPAGYHHYS